MARLLAIRMLSWLPLLFGSTVSVAQVGYEMAFPNLQFSRPVDIQHPGDGSGRLFVVEQEGRIYAIANDLTTTDKTTFIDLADRVDSGGEMGLLGLAFHPDFTSNGLFFVNYTASNPRRSVVARFRVLESDSNRGDPASETVLLTAPQPYSNHNGGQLAFGLDGYLYVALGDGGSARDPQGNGQNRTTLLGSLLRIDVDRSEGGKDYAIPDDNPFAGNGEGFREEIYAYGFRNPWRFSFDRATGSLWLADVGQDHYEEINLVEKGGNYGWNIREGDHCFPIGTNCAPADVEPPLWEYPHNGGDRSITGGYVYRGERVPELVGDYVYADFVEGNVWSLGFGPDSALVNTEHFEFPLITTFGVDETGDVLFSAFDGRIYRFTSSAATSGNAAVELPDAVELEALYPSPSWGEATIEYRVNRAGWVRLDVVDLLGRRRKVVFEGFTSAGRHQVRLNAARLPAGAYLVRLQLDEHTRIRRFLIAR